VSNTDVYMKTMIIFIIATCFKTKGPSPGQKYQNIKFAFVKTFVLLLMWKRYLIYRVLISSYPDQEGNKLGSMSRTRGISTISRPVLPSMFFFFPPCKAERRRKFTPFWQKHWLVSFLVGLRTYQHPCTIPFVTFDADVCNFPLNLAHIIYNVKTSC